MNIWPWSRISFLEDQLQAVCARLEHAEIAELDSQQLAILANDELNRHQALNTLLKVKITQLERALENKTNELATMLGTGNPVVLAPPTERVASPADHAESMDDRTPAQMYLDALAEENSFGYCWHLGG